MCALKRTAESACAHKRTRAPHPPAPTPPRTLPAPTQSDNVWSDKVRFGDLPKEEKKVVSKIFNASKLRGGDSSNVCAREISLMLTCFEGNEWETAPCQPQINEMYQCVELHKNDPVSDERHWRG